MLLVLLSDMFSQSCIGWKGPMGLPVTDTAGIGGQLLQVTVQRASSSHACWRVTIDKNAFGPLWLVPKLTELSSISCPVRRLRISPECHDHLNMSRHGQCWFCKTIMVESVFAVMLSIR